MEAQAKQIGRKVLGPFDVLDCLGGDTVPVTNFPFAQVQGGTVSVVLAGDVTASPAGGTFSVGTFEVEIIGIVQGQEDVLKRGWLTENSGPLRKTFEGFEVYETIEIRARNMVGGRTGGNLDVAAGVANTTANGFKVQLTVNLQPRKAEDVRV